MGWSSLVWKAFPERLDFVGIGVCGIFVFQWAVRFRTSKALTQKAQQKATVMTGEAVPRQLEEIAGR